MRGRAIRCVWTAMSGACGFNIMSNAFKSHDMTLKDRGTRVEMNWSSRLVKNVFRNHSPVTRCSLYTIQWRQIHTYDIHDYRL